jgi:hypothetical protein
MGIDDVVANDPDVHLQSSDLAAVFGDVHLQSSDLAAVFGNSMSDRDPKDRPFCSYARTEVLWMSYGVLISM